MPAAPPDIHVIFNEAVARESDEDRLRYLDEVCGGAPDVRRRVEALLRAHSEAGGFFGGQATAPPPTEIRPGTGQPGDTIGPYKLLQQIGEGGMGVVYMAEQSEPVERRVALKIIKPGMDTRQVIARFEAERQALAMMDHPNIARVLDAGTTGGVEGQGPRVKGQESPHPSSLIAHPSSRPYFVMELVKGVPITQYCDEHQLTPRERLELFLPVCQAVQHAHQKGIIHRDLKPSNILVSEYDDRPVPKVIDFGVAKAVSQRLTEKTMFTQYGQIVGTLEYMSPEQAKLNELDVDTRSDVYALGVLLYELLTGVTPLDRQRLKAAAFDEILRLIREEEPQKPSTRLSTAETLPSIAANRKTEPKKLSGLLRGELDWIVMKALEKDRSRRYETANGLAADVLRYLANEPVSACPQSAAYRFRKFARRNKARLIMAGVIGAALLLSVGSLGWMVRERTARAQEATRRATEQVELILDDVDRLVKDQNWPEALAAAKRADAVVQGGHAAAETELRLRQTLANLDLVRQLEEIRLLESELRQESFNAGGTDEAYARAFARAGLAVEGLTVEQAADQLRARSEIVTVLATALMDWARIRSGIVHGTNDLSWRRLLEVADEIDPDAGRRRLRAIWTADRFDLFALRDLAASPEARTWPASTVYLVAQLMRYGAAPQDAVSLLTEARDRHPDDFWITFALANCLQDTPGRLEDAYWHFQMALSLRGPHPGIYSSLGSVREQQRRYDEALDWFHRALDLRPDNAMFHYNVGVTLMNQGKPVEAEGAFCEAIRLKQDAHIAHSNLGMVLKRQGRLSDAIAAYRTAVELQPNDGIARNGLAGALQEAGQLEEAVEQCQETIRRHPQYASPYATLAGCLFQLDRVDEAISQCQKALELQADHATAHLNLGACYFVQNRLDLAEHHFRSAIRSDSNDPIAHYNLANVLQDSDNPTAAIDEYREAIRLNPVFVAARENLAGLLKELGDVEGAERVMHEASQLLGRSADEAGRPRQPGAANRENDQGE
jgi:serine/threonine protein kinase/tetratricopeptide (TPR) repeat protein